MNSHHNDKKLLWLEWAILIAILILAAWLRYWRLDQVPPGFNSDEAVGAVGALTTLRQGVQYSYEGQGGGGALGFYFAAAAFHLFGASVTTIRGLAAWAGLVSILFNYWAMREIFRAEGLARARWLAGLSTLALAVSHWHVSSSRVAFAGIGVPFLMMPSVYFLWLGLNRADPAPSVNRQSKIVTLWPFALSGLFLGGLMYIYLSGVFAPPLYAAFFMAQWLLVKPAQKFRWPAQPPQPYLTRQFWNLFTTVLVAALLLLPMVVVLLTRPELEPGAARAGQAFFMNPQINQGDPWGLLWRSIVGNLGAFGISPLWLVGQAPRLSVPTVVGLFGFLGFLISVWRGLRGRASYLFMALWLPVMLLPSILSPDSIPHNLRALGAAPALYAFVAVFVVWLFTTLHAAGQRWLLPRLGMSSFTKLLWAAGLILAAGLAWPYGQGVYQRLHYYFYVFPTTNDAQSAYHVYAVKMAEVINREPNAAAAFILPRNTAAGDVFRNFTTDFLTDLAQPPAAHYWVIDDERTLPADLTVAAANHSVIRLVRWKTSKHTGADPKTVLPYFLEKYGHFDRTDAFEYFNIDTYALETPAPNFTAGETLRPVEANFGGQLNLTGFALGDAGAAAHVAAAQAAANDLLWLRLAWQKSAAQPENLKVSALLVAADGRQVAQMDKLLLSNILQVGSAAWPAGAAEDTYFLMPIPPATPPGRYRLELVVYGADTFTRLPVQAAGVQAGSVLPLAEVAIIPARKPVQANDLPLALRVNRALAPGLTLAGFESLPAGPVRPGDRLDVTLVWQAGNPPPATNWQMTLRAKATQGRADWPLSDPAGLAGPDYPATAWQPGELLRGWVPARIPPALEPGVYELELALTAPAASPVILPVGEFTVEGRPRQFNPPQPQFTINADFGGQATLVGLDAAAAHVAPGATLTARLYWRVDQEFTEDYTAFIHLIGPDGRLAGQVDQTPGGGAFPTTGWLPGEYIADDYTLTVAPDAPAGQYQFEIGMYNPANGQRLPVTLPNGSTDDKILLPGVAVP